MPNSSSNLNKPRLVNPEQQPGRTNMNPAWRNQNQQANQLPVTPYPARVINSNQLQVVNDYAVGIDTTYGNTTLTLLPASTEPPLLVRVKWVAGTNTATIAAQAGDTIDGNPTLVLGSLNSAVDLLSVGNNQWWIMGSH